MNRRTFVHHLGLASLGICGAADALELRGADSAKRPAMHRNWIWTGLDERSTPDQQKRRFETIREAGIQAVLFSGVSADVFALAKEQGLETHAWTWTLCRGDRKLLNEHPDWYGVSRLGDSTANKPPYVDYYHFLCPSREEVRAYVTELFSALADTPNLDGVHLDYVRYPDVILPVALWKQYNLVQNEELPQFDFCYCSVCRAAFKKKSGVDPLELPDPTADEAWRQYRYDSVTQLVNRVAEAARQKGKQVTAAVFPSPSLARKLVRQDWPKWNLDAVLPMVYHSFYNETVDWIEPTVREGVAALPPERPLYAGLYLPDLKTEEQFDQAVRCARAGGGKGVALFGGLRTVKSR
ncbi:MAG: family 10 glycosylhydrolase [Verrucomicrobiia bacterium]